MIFSAVRALTCDINLCMRIVMLLCVLSPGIQGGMLASPTQWQDHPVPGPLSLELALRPNQDRIAFADREFVLTFHNTSDRAITLDGRLLRSDMARLINARGKRVKLTLPSPPRALEYDDIISLPPGGRHEEIFELITLARTVPRLPPYTLYFCYSNMDVT